MIEYVRNFFKGLKLLLFFALLTAAFYTGLTWIDGHEERVHRYDQPGSDAVKVSLFSKNQVSDILNGEKINLSRRLIEFLRDGE